MFKSFFLKWNIPKSKGGVVVVSLPPNVNSDDDLIDAVAGAKLLDGLLWNLHVYFNTFL